MCKHVFIIIVEIVFARPGGETKNLKDCSTVHLRVYCSNIAFLGVFLTVYQFSIFGVALKRIDV